MPAYPNGAGQSLGDTLATCAPLYTSGDIWYVSSATGSNSTTPRGLDATRPLATLAQAVSNAANGDIVVLMDGHTETIATGGLTISKNLTIVGAGSSEGLPTAKLTPFGEDAACLTISGAAVQLRNVWIEERTVDSTTNATLVVTGASFQMIGCYCQAGQYDYYSLSLGSGANNARLVNTTFISTATALSAQPDGAVIVAAAISDLDLDGLVLSGGGYGFSSPYAFTATAAAITRLKGQSVSLLLGADMSLHASTTGHVNVQTTTGSGRVVWTGM